MLNLAALYANLNLTGNGMLILSGTPSSTDGGIYRIKLEAADTVMYLLFC
jgi:hypothetical protein